MQLVIVESPTKARKLREYLGSSFTVEASVGHVRDLPRNKIGVDVEHNFQPEYIVSPEKQKVVDLLLKKAAKAEQIVLATDPDREGEAIAWHVQDLLQAKMKKGKFVRATFHEITKPAVLAAIAKPTKVNIDLVEAQQARRVLDRLVGYTLSPLLWRKVRRGLSAGRVQSAALRLIAEREKEIQEFVPEEYWEVSVALSLDARQPAPVFTNLKTKRDQPPADMIIARLEKVSNKTYEPKTAADVEPIAAWLPKADYQVQSVEAKDRRRQSFPPFTTSTLQQAAANKLGYTSKQAMKLAQNLYEEGLITYHRTDAVSLSQQSIQAAREFIAAEYGESYLPAQPRYFANKSKNAQEAHEAIRPTNVRQLANQLSEGRLTSAHHKLYDLIWRRFVACQMSEAVTKQTTVLIDGKHQDQNGLFKATGSVVVFDGWTKLTSASEERILPALAANQVLHFGDLETRQNFTQPPARFNDASLVKELEKRGIGRPSTYASIISVLEERGYVDRDQRRFVATAIGMTVNEFLTKHFSEVVDYDFTAEMEEDLDRIARGEKEWTKVLQSFYQPYNDKLAKVGDKAKRIQIPVEETGETCPECGTTDGGKIVIRSGKYGKFRSCSRFPDCKFTEAIIEKIPDQHCPLCGEGDVIIKNSRWGRSFFGCSRYPNCDWASWQKPAPDLKITPAEWQEMQAARKEKAAKRAATLKAKGAKTKSVRKTSKKATAKKTATKKVGSRAKK